MTERNERIRAALVALIESEGLNYSEFARKYNVPRAALTHWCSGRNGISAANLEKIRDVYPDFAR